MYSSPWQLRATMAKFIESYDRQWYQEGIGNFTPSDVDYGRREAILQRREADASQFLLSGVYCTSISREEDGAESFQWRDSRVGVMSIAIRTSTSTGFPSRRTG